MMDEKKNSFTMDRSMIDDALHSDTFLTDINDFFSDEDTILPAGPDELTIDDILSQALAKLQGKDTQEKEIDYSTLSDDEILEIVRHDRELYSIDELLLEEEMLKEFEPVMATDDILFAFWNLRRNGVKDRETMRECIRSYYDEDEEEGYTIEEMMETVSEERERYSAQELQLEEEMLKVFADTCDSDVIRIAFWFALQNGTPDADSVRAHIQALISDES